MATLEKRVEDLEYIIAHLPDDLNARFAGVDVKLAVIREAQTLHSQRFTTLELKVDGLERKVDGIERKVDGLERKVDGLASQIAEVLQRLQKA